jgi:hypothetical protein
MTFNKQDVLEACTTYGPLLTVPDGLDPVRIMGAIASNESSFGANCGPRHEPAFDTGGPYCTGFQATLVEKYGANAASSWGPWQMLFVNFHAADMDSIPTGTLEMFAQEFVWFFNSYVMGVRKPTTLEQIGQVYNGGHVMTNPGPGVVAYCQKLQAAYDSLEGVLA